MFDMLTAGRTKHQPTNGSTGSAPGHNSGSSPIASPCLLLSFPTPRNKRLMTCRTVDVATTSRSSAEHHAVGSEALTMNRTPGGTEQEAKDTDPSVL